jgi:hypothetical protein
MLSFPCRTISQDISIPNCTAKTPRGSTRRDQARRLAPRVHVASARLRAFTTVLQVYCLVPAHQKKSHRRATGGPPLLGYGRSLIHCPKLISYSQLGTTIDRQIIRVLRQLWLLARFHNTSKTIPSSESTDYSSWKWPWSVVDRTGRIARGMNDLQSGSGREFGLLSPISEPGGRLWFRGRI